MKKSKLSSALPLLNKVDGQNDHQPKSQATAGRLSEQYKVSSKTIRRDAKLSAAIDAISEASPEAKRKILAGEVQISRKRLEALSSASKEEIESAAAEIEEGIYEGRAQRGSAPAETDIASDSILPEIRQLNAIISDFASSFNSMFRSLNAGGSVEVKSVLRSYIDQLEDLYKNM